MYICLDAAGRRSRWLGANPNQPQGGGGAWPGQQPPNPAWPGGPAQPSAPAPQWPGGPSGPSQPSGPAGGWPGGPTQPAAGGWPAGPTQPAAGGWPTGPSGPGQPSPAPAPVPGPTFPVAPQQSLAVPLHQPFPQGLENKTITIRGTVKPNAKFFNIDFCAASDIAFHFNPRFNEEGKKVIVRNSMIGKMWGKEERDGPFPFIPGQNFDIKIEVTRSGFQITVNGSRLSEFRHRNLNPRDIKQVNVCNDITLSHFSAN
uniref:Galectin n=1 Tax=Neogobius melanostomus TaxID=47308 RepID=A0A8C6T515_9GOBI